MDLNDSWEITMCDSIKDNQNKLLSRYSHFDNISANLTLNPTSKNNESALSNGFFEEKQDSILLEKKFFITLNKTYNKSLECKVSGYYSDGFNAQLFNQPFDSSKIREIDQIYNSTSIEQAFRILYSILPNDSVKLGDQWTPEQTTLYKPYNLLNAACIFKELSGGKAIIEIEAQIESDTIISVVYKGKFKGSTTRNGIRKGKIQVDIKTGWIEYAIFNDLTESHMRMTDSLGNFISTQDFKSKTTYEYIGDGRKEPLSTFED